MTCNIIGFPSSSPARREATTRVYRTYQSGRPNIRTLAFRSYDQILKADEDDLIDSVCRDLTRARSKLERTQGARKDLEERTSEQLKMLATAETKLAGAIVAALLLTMQR